LSRDAVQGAVQIELTRVQEALNAGNDGKARACARRAAGLAISFWLQNRKSLPWGLDSMNQLQAAAAEESLPGTVRQAALRLTTKITDRLAAPFSTDPLADAGILVDYFLADS